MKSFTCPTCGSEIFFENTLCVTCGRTCVFDPGSGNFNDAAQTRPCANRTAIACNWRAAERGLCWSCATTHVIPDLRLPENRGHWDRIERAKRRLFQTLLRLGLPLSRNDLALRFHLLGDFQSADGNTTQVMTGHNAGLVTLNIAEADDSMRHANRVKLGEPYRTLLGHLRHESGHFYWTLLVKDQDEAGFAALFGDPVQDYGLALSRHYAATTTGQRPVWSDRHISAYASAHPWEDFAETWAHYLHMADALETAGSRGLIAGDMRWTGLGIEPMIAAWMPLSISMNEMNRSLGQDDFYPFVIPRPVVAKLDYIHRLIGLAA